MTDLPTAIARLQADDDSIYVEMVKAKYPAWKAFRPHEMATMRDSFRDADRQIVLESLLDARPITAEGLVEAGFEKNQKFCELVYRFANGAELSVGLPGGRIVCWLYNPPSGSGVTICRDMEPQTTGDVHTLLLRLARGNG